MTLTSRFTPSTERVLPSDHFRGRLTAPVTLVEYGEYECVHCGRAHHTIQRLLEEAEGEVRFVFRHFARDDVHPFSERSALAAEAAGAQGRFWEMHDFLFEHQHQLEHAELVRHAGELGLDTVRFNADLIERKHLSVVKAHLERGMANGVVETPTFFINGMKYSGGYDLESLLVAVRSAPAIGQVA